MYCTVRPGAVEPPSWGRDPLNMTPAIDCAVWRYVMTLYFELNKICKGRKKRNMSRIWPKHIQKVMHRLLIVISCYWWCLASGMQHLLIESTLMTTLFCWIIMVQLSQLLKLSAQSQSCKAAAGYTCPSSMPAALNQIHDSRITFDKQMQSTNIYGNRLQEVLRLKSPERANASSLKLLM